LLALLVVLAILAGIGIYLWRRGIILASDKPKPPPGGVSTAEVLHPPVSETPPGPQAAIPPPTTGGSPSATPKPTTRTVDIDGVPPVTKGTTTEPCETRFYATETRGKKRMRPCVPNGKPTITMFYMGNSEWQIVLSQMGTVIVEELTTLELHKKVVCPPGLSRLNSDTVVKTITAWVPTGSQVALCSREVLETIKAGLSPGSLPPAAIEAPFPVKKALEDAADKVKKSGKDVNVIDTPIDTSPPPPDQTITGVTEEESVRREVTVMENEETRRIFTGEAPEHEEPHSGYQHIDEPGKRMMEREELITKIFGSKRAKVEDLEELMKLMEEEKDAF
jgi:hypothetical protein